MIRERLDKWCEKGIFVLAIAVLAFGPLATGAVLPWQFLVVQGLTLAAALLWLIRLWLNANQRVLWPPVCWAVLAFVMYAIIRYRQADIEYVARQELIRVLTYEFLFFVILNNLAHQDSAQRLSFVLIFLGMGLSMYAVYQFATKSPYAWHVVKPLAFQKRGSGTYINPNDLAGLLEMLVPLGFAYALAGRLDHLPRVFLGYASLVMLAGICVTLSRGGWAATAVTMGLFFALLVRRREYRIPALIVLAALAGAGFYFFSKADRLQKRLDNVLLPGSPDNGQFRLWLWGPTMQMWKDHPWLGVGPGLFDYRFPAYRPEEVQARPGFAHNDYLNTLVDWGVVGTSLVAASFVLLYAGVFKTWRFVGREQSAFGTKPSNRAAFVLGASIGLLAILVHSFTDFNMHVPANAILAVSLMALLSGHLRYVSDRYWVVLRWTGRILITLIGLAALLYLGHQGWRRARECLLLERATKEKTYSSVKISALKKAIEIEPNNFDTTYALGEALRRRGWDGDQGSEKLISQAMDWFKRGIRLNPYDPYNYMKLGMCLDWLGRHDEAAPYFSKAVQCDPNNYYVLAHQGWHFVQVGDYAAAKPWFERSVHLQHAWHNPYAASYLRIIERELKKEGKPK